MGIISPREDAAVSPPRNMHHGRAWHGHELEDSCPCPKAPCGLTSGWTSGCEQHDPAFCRTMRQGHWPEDCPGAA